MKFVEDESARVEALAKKGDPTEAWRFAARALFSRDDLVRTFGMETLFLLVGRSRQDRFPAEALVETRLVHGSDLGYAEKFTMTLSGITFENRPAQPDALLDLYEAFDRARQIRDSHHLSGDTKDFAMNCLNRTTLELRMPGVLILLATAETDSRQREWAIRQLHQCASSAGPGDRKVLEFAYEAAAGEYYSRWVESQPGIPATRSPGGLQSP